MLNEFLKVAYDAELKKQGQQELSELLEKLPPAELRKLADGAPTAQLYAHLEKSASMDCIKAADDSPTTFLDRFKGTPLFEQALALEQEELQADMLDQQRQEERQMEGSPWMQRDKIRLKKRMLELELAKGDAGVPAQGAGAPGPVPAEGVQDDSQGLQGGVAKMAAQQVAFADRVGRELAQQDFEKAAEAELLNVYSAYAGTLMAKTALGMGDVVGALGKAAPMAQKALGFAAKHPTAVGAGIGAAGGALAGGPNHRLSGAIGGAGLGAAAGGVAQGMAGGQSFAQSAQGLGSSLLGKAKSMVGGGSPPSGRAQIPYMGQGMGTPSMAPPNVRDFAQRNALGQPKMAMAKELVQILTAG